MGVQGAIDAWQYGIPDTHAHAQAHVRTMLKPDDVVLIARGPFAVSVNAASSNNSLGAMPAKEHTGNSRKNDDGRCTRVGALHRVSQRDDNIRELLAICLRAWHQNGLRKGVKHTTARVTAISYEEGGVCRAMQRTARAMRPTGPSSGILNTPAFDCRGTTDNSAGRHVVNQRGDSSE